MNRSTRTRLLDTATSLFAEHGYRGASVRHICDLARANPGAVSYHFGGKRQLYRTVLRRAAAALADLRINDTDPGDDSPPLSIHQLLERIVDRLEAHPTETRLLLRDLADGGDVAVEALEPTLRAAHQYLETSIEDEIVGDGAVDSRGLFLDIAAPLFLLTTAWPVLQRALDLDPDRRRDLLTASCRRMLAAHGCGDLST